MVTAFSDRRGEKHVHQKMPDGDDHSKTLCADVKASTIF